MQQINKNKMRHKYLISVLIIVLIVNVLVLNCSSTNVNRIVLEHNEADDYDTFKLSQYAIQSSHDNIKSLDAKFVSLRDLETVSKHSSLISNNQSEAIKSRSKFLPSIIDFIQPKVHLMSQIAIYLVFFVILFTCIFGNILVIISVFTYKPLKSVQNIFIVSLAFADMLVALFVMPFHIAYQITNGKWIFGKLVCHFFLTLDILLCTSSTLHLCCIALDRYWAIKDSIKYAQKRTMKRVLSMIAIAWTSSAVVSLPVIVWNTKTVRSVSDNNNNHNNERLINDSTIAYATFFENKDENIVCDIPFDKLYRFYSSSGTFFVPLFIMSFVYARIYLETKRRLGERSRAAKKLANSMAKSTQNQIIATDSQSNANPKTNFSIFFPCYSCVREKLRQREIRNRPETILAMVIKEIEENTVYCDENRSQIDDSDSQDNLHDSSSKSNCKQEPHGLLRSRENLNKSKVSVGINTEQFNRVPRIIINNAESSADQSNSYKNKDISKLLLVDANAHKSVSKNATPAWVKDNMSTGMALKQRQKISLTRERKAARTMSIIMGAFIICWLPFFVVYVCQSFNFFMDMGLFEFLTWLGYVNSSLNPIIYTVFNIDFRKSFERILFQCVLFKRS